MRFRIGYKIKKSIRRLGLHIIHFWPMVLALLLLLVASRYLPDYDWSTYKDVIRVTLILVIILLCWKPMNAVYGLMGTSGSIPLFFINFITITLLFAAVYHWAFFKDAGISYDVNQPHIDYSMFLEKSSNSSDTTIVAKKGVRIIENRDTLLFERAIDKISFKEVVVNVRRDTLYYQPIDFWQVWRSSILTTLIQEPAALLTSASVNNAGMESSDLFLDKQKSDLFEWILIFHIIVSWIFFGVFISLLYNKFRYES